MATRKRRSSRRSRSGDGKLRQYVVEIDHGPDRDTEIVGSVKLPHSADRMAVGSAISRRGIMAPVSRVTWHRTRAGTKPSATFFDFDGDVIGYLYEEEPD